jgi:hypothetical protein
LGSAADEENMSKEVAEVNETIMQQSGAIDLINDADNSFIDANSTNIQKARDTIAGQWR